MSTADQQEPKPQPERGVGCLPFIIGAVIGFALGFAWGDSRDHVIGQNYVVRGEHRGMLVIGDAVIGALIGGFAVYVAARIRRALKKKA